MIVLKAIDYSQQGKRITYDYEVSPDIKKFFNAKVQLFVSYNDDISQLPQSINVIPFLANIMPIAWFAGFDVAVEECDSEFFESLEDIRNEWTKIYPELKSKQSTLRVKKLVQNSKSCDKSAMLFSGGVDAFATYFRHRDENPELITIQGADIPLTDALQWQDVQDFNETEPILVSNKKHYIKTNFQQFYTANVDFLLPNLGWWGNIQHGLALTGITAPLAFRNCFGKLYIASTRSIHMEFNPWGSMPETDNKIRWAGLSVIHDAFELKRQDKVDTIVAAVKQIGTNTTLRVCYSELKEKLNCSRCEKCIRTMFGIMMAGGDPNNFGFVADENIYAAVQRTVDRGFKTRGTQFFWGEILEQARSTKNAFEFTSSQAEVDARQQTLLNIQSAIKKDIITVSPAKKLKHGFINRYPKFFKWYLKIRRSL